MRVTALKTPVITAGQDLFPIIVSALKEQGGLPERSIIAVTSKIIAYSQNRLVPKTAQDLADPVTNKAHKHQLARQEAELFLPPDNSQYNLMFTIKNGTISVNTGIDESNAGNNFVLWPEKLPEFLAELWSKLRTEFNIKELGLVVTDSKIYPLRWGVTATCLAHCGFQAVYDCRGQQDLFGRTMEMERVNISEAVAISAALEMGEVAEQKPLALVTEVQTVTFQDRPPTHQELAELIVDPKDDFFAPLLNAVTWHKGGSSN
jgi:F420-0:gamma-glutamyl ligase